MADQSGIASDIDADRDKWDEEDNDSHFTAEDLDDMEFLYNAGEAFTEASYTLASKHKDYGPLNISNSPGGPLVGLSVRLHDKVARLANLIGRENETQHEPLHDTFLDIANYGIIGMMVVDGKWPEENKKK
jgi:hypothetical protein